MSTEAENQLEEELQKKGLFAPRLSPASIDAVIVEKNFWVVPMSTCTVCALTLRNGFIVVGKSAAASPENFNREIGEKIAYEDARRQVWALEGYLLRQWLWEQHRK